MFKKLLPVLLVLVFTLTWAGIPVSAGSSIPSLGLLIAVILFSTIVVLYLEK